MCSLCLPHRCVLLAVLFIAGCSSSSHYPKFFSSGYTSEGRVVRLWLKQSDPDSFALRTLVMTSWQQPAVQMDYRWYKHALTYLQRGGADANAEQVTLRFSHRGQVTFMQRQFAGVRQSLSQQEVSDYQLTAEQELNKSRRLISQQIKLGQGEWLGNNTVAICQQSPAIVAFSEEQQQIINHQSTQRRVFVAWLNTTEGRQLLMVTGQNLCQSQPSQDNL